MIKDFKHFQQWKGKMRSPNVSVRKMKGDKPNPEVVIDMNQVQEMQNLQDLSQFSGNPHPQNPGQLHPLVAAPEVNPDQEESESSCLCWVIIGVVVILLLVGGYFMFIRKKPEPILQKIGITRSVPVLFGTSKTQVAPRGYAAAILGTIGMITVPVWYYWRQISERLGFGSSEAQDEGEKEGAGVTPAEESKGWASVFTPANGILLSIVLGIGWGVRKCCCYTPPAVNGNDIAAVKNMNTADWKDKNIDGVDKGDRSKLTDVIERIDNTYKMADATTKPKPVEITPKERTLLEATYKTLSQRLSDFKQAQQLVADAGDPAKETPSQVQLDAAKKTLATHGTTANDLEAQVKVLKVAYDFANNHPLPRLTRWYESFRALPGKFAGNSQKGFGMVLARFSPFQCCGGERWTESKIHQISGALVLMFLMFSIGWLRSLAKIQPINKQGYYRRDGICCGDYTLLYIGKAFVYCTDSLQSAFFSQCGLCFLALIGTMVSLGWC